MAYTYDYPHAAITADCCVFGFDGNQLQILLIQRREEPHKGQWAFPGGFLRMDETLEECARRELVSETKLKPQYLEQFRVFSQVDRDPRERVVTVAFLALVPKSNVQGGEDAARAQWFDIDKTPYLAFDHQLIFEAARVTLSERLRHEPLGLCMLGDTFSDGEVKRLYEQILGDSDEAERLMVKTLEQKGVRPAKTQRAAGEHQRFYSFAASNYAKLKDLPSSRLKE